MYCSFLLEKDKSYIKIWNGKNDTIIKTKNKDNARIFELGWIKKNSEKIKELNIKLIPIEKKVNLYGLELDVEDIKDLEPMEQNKCCKCGSENNLKKYNMMYRGYGSIFDSMITSINVCPNCDSKELEEWFNEEPKHLDYSEKYENEEKLLKWLEELPTKGKEHFFNSNRKDESILNNKIWILKEKGILKSTEYKNMDYYSPCEIEEYNKKFPLCDKVFIKIYSDGSKGARCEVTNAFGSVEGDKIVAGLNISDKCYECKFFNKK